MAARVLLDKRHARGLDSDILAAIRTEVFDIGEPKPKLELSRPRPNGS